MTVKEYLEEHNLDYDDIHLVDEDGKEYKAGTLIQYCKVIGIEENKIIIK